MPIFDQGYQHWTGELTGHAWRWLAITRHGVRIGMKNRLLRVALLVSWLPAIALGFMLCVWGLLERKSEMVTGILPFLNFLGPQVIADPVGHRVAVWTLCYDYFLLTEMRLSMVLVLIVGPSLISQDLRFNALPLYFSRPLRRIDYFVGKLGVIAVFLGMVTIVPSLLAYALGLMFSLDFTIVRDTLPLLLASVAYGAVISLSAGTLILALSSLSRNSRYVALFWLAVWIVSGITGHVLESVSQQQRAYNHYRRLSETRRVGPSGAAGRTPAEQRQDQRARDEAQKKLRDEYEDEERRASEADWRPLVSYTSNLSRVGRPLLGTDAAWQKLAEHQPPEERGRFLRNNVGPRYPWYWSAGVLAVLFGLSACILNFRVKSLDRLK